MTVLSYFLDIIVLLVIGVVFYAGFKFGRLTRK